MKKLITITTILIGLVSCEQSKESSIKEEKKYTYTQEVNESDTFIRGKRQLKAQGYKNIVEISKPWYCCDDKDSFWSSTGFQATDEDGNSVKGCFCVKTGLFNNSITIRFE